MIVTFCGHSEIDQTESFSTWLDMILPSLIEGERIRSILAATGLLTVWPQRRCGDKRKPIPILK